MTQPAPVLHSSLRGLVLTRSGKVRDIYEADGCLILVATDRISAFDHVLGSGIPDKGKVLTQLSAFWFERTRDIVANHMVSIRPEEYPEPARGSAETLRGRSMLVRHTHPVPLECVARAYLSGSAWTEYQRNGEVCGIPLPPGLRESDRLPEPIFTPATKAEHGHDVNLTEDEATRLVGRQTFDRLRDLTLRLYARGAAHAETCGLILADCKFEFGWHEGGLMLIDEALTPDASRFWCKDRYRPGMSQPSFDKQYVRDYLESIGWNKQPPVPVLPDEVVARTREKYLEAFRRLTGRDLE